MAFTTAAGQNHLEIMTAPQLLPPAMNSDGQRPVHPVDVVRYVEKSKAQSLLQSGIEHLTSNTRADR
jgi:hypothetical protein